jgi:multisubunit Na+/H+ antiporter MnhB subunit
MTTEVIVGLFAMVIGILAFWQRDRVSHWAGAWNKRFGKPVEVISDFATPKAYGISGLLMATAGLGIVVFSLVTGQSLRRTGESEALAVIVVAGLLLVILLAVGAALVYRKYRK